jgi:triacylglycerol lipase
MVPPGAVPARISDLTGLPPTFIGVGALDLFVEEGLDFARRLLLAGVPVELHVVPGAYHGFDGADAAISARFRDRLWAALRDGLSAEAARPNPGPPTVNAYCPT